MVEADLLSNVLLPIASEEDARATARELEPYDPEAVTALYVIQKRSNAPAKTPVSGSGERGAKAFAAVREFFPDVTMETAFSDDIVGMIHDTAEEIDASAIVFRSRGGNRLVQLLTGDKSLKLVTRADRPVVALPDRSAED